MTPDREKITRLAAELRDLYAAVSDQTNRIRDAGGVVEVEELEHFSMGQHHVVHVVTVKIVEKL